MTAKKISNKAIADIFKEISLLLKAEAVPFKPQAYELAANSIASLDKELSELYKKCGLDCLKELPGVGASISEKIAELLTTGRLKYYTQLKKKYPFDMLSLTAIPEVGPKIALHLYKKLKIKNTADLGRAAKAGKLAKLANLGEKSQENILRGLTFVAQDKGRFLLHEILPLAEKVRAKIAVLPGVSQCEVAGSIRRRQETIGDIDLLITTSNPEHAIKTFKNLPEIDKVIEEGETKLAVRYKAGINGDLRVLKPNEYGAALQYFTGSKEHNIEVRKIASKKGYKLSEYGLFKGNKRLAGKTEEEIYKKLGMDWIEPELRTASGEIEAAQKHSLPKLIGYHDLKGDLQIQTNWTDGAASIEEMAQAAKALGLSYIAITDHTKSLSVTNGLDEKKLLKQGKEIDALNKKLKGFRILKSTECDVLKNGSLDLNDAALQTLDLVCVSVHSFFSMNEAEMTERIIRAIKHPLVNILFHPTGRVLKMREAYKLDMGKIFRAAREYKVVIEINSSQRMDLKDTHVRQALKEKVKLIINSDAHTPEALQNLRYGIAQARRGWATKTDILNTKSVEEFLRAIKKKEAFPGVGSAS